MTAYCNSSVPKFKINSELVNNKREMFSSPYSKILHDPECQSQCCSINGGQSIQGNNFNGVEQLYNVTVHYSDRIDTPTSNENQFLYNVIATNNLVPEYPENPSQTVIDSLGMSIPHLCFEKPIERIRYSNYSTSSECSAEGQSNQKSYCKGAVKRKRKRTVFSTDQIVVMERVFKKRPYVSREERLLLTKKLNISEKTIKIWFQNRRRVTEKKEKDQSDSCHSDSTSEEVCNDYTSRLDYIESQINQNTDELGFVTLNSKAITELVKLIDDVLSRDIVFRDSLSESSGLYENKKNEELNASYIMYEPISPESLSEDYRENEDISNWEPSKPEESLQRLIDIQTVLFS